MINFSYKKILYISVVLHLICAVFSSGFHHFDEHFQIYEFLNLKLGGIDGARLPWEYSDMVRPWFQVYIYYGIYKFFSAFGLSSPFATAFIFRILTTLFGVFAFYKFIPTLKSWFKTEKGAKICFLLLNFLWFIPYIQTRTNAESVSATFFVLGLIYFLKSLDKNSIGIGITAGLLLGASYNVRYQLALMVMFLWFWALAYKRASVKPIISSAIAIAFMIFLGVLIDYIGYGQWTFAPYNLYVSNFIKKRLEHSGEDPFWYYFKVCFLRGIPLVSLPLILATMYGFFKQKKHPLTWSLLPLLLFHSYVGHKELRYIFPVILLSPIYLAWAIEEFDLKLVNKLWKRFLIKFAIGVNCILLVFSILRPANPSVNFYKYLYDNDIKEFYYSGENPFTMLGLPIEYYKSKDLKPTSYNNLGEIKSKEAYLFFRKGHDIVRLEENKNCQRKFLAYPAWSLNFNIGNWVSRSRVWSLYHCKLN